MGEARRRRKAGFQRSVGKPLRPMVHPQQAVSICRSADQDAREALGDNPT
jgi:hypothetical protein